MRVLLVTYHFPPDAEIGGVRPLQIARHLPQLGIEPWVLTVEPRFAESPNVGLLPAGVPDNRIIRTPVATTAFNRAVQLWQMARRLAGNTEGKERGPVASPSRIGSRRRVWKWARPWLGFPDERFGWYRPALRAADELLRRVHFDAVVSTSPPRVAAFIAASLSRRHPIPWIMDLRDPWFGWHESTASHRRPSTIAFLQQVLFRRSVAGATLVVHNTERLRKLTCQLIPDAEPKTRCIPNGCDSEWVGAGAGTSPTAFRVSHYGQIMGRRNAGVFLQGLRLWLDSAPPDAALIAVRFVGSGFEDLARDSQALGLGSFVELVPAVPRQDVPALMAADFALLLLANAQPLQVPGKTYEYLASGRRILALTEHDGATADVLSAEKGCFVVETAEEVRGALVQLHADYQAALGAHVDRAARLAELQYSRRVERFAELLREVAPARSRHDSA